jgi:threonylcarbamoyladenosine tRNA methylthiotransferase MtaB
VIGRVQALVHEGHAEVVITGVDLGSYGEDHASLPDLGGLLGRVLVETKVERIRVSSLEPGDFDQAWLPLWQSPRLCRHLHVPLQAGSAAVLQRMERKYSPREFADMVAACRRAIPDLTVTTDVMVGFPGETDEEFDEGYHFIRHMRFDGMHVFKYSQRSGTRAARFSDQVPEPVKHERSRLLREEARMGVDRLVRRHANRVWEVVWESQSDDIWRGLTDTNVRVYGSPRSCRVGSLARARLTFPFRDGLWSESTHAEIPLVAIPS